MLQEPLDGRQILEKNTLAQRRNIARAVARVAAGSGLTRLLRRRRHRRGDFRVFLLEYHDVGPGPAEPEGTISAARFRRHLAYLRRHYRCLTLEAAAERLAAPQGLAEDVAVVTFDDGYAGNYEAAWPPLAELGVPATIFLTSGFLDGQGLWFDLARRLLAGAARSPRAAEVAAALAEALGETSPRETEAIVGRLKYLDPARRDRLLARLAERVEPQGQPARPLRWEDVRALAAAGVEFGAHTVSHPILSTLEEDEQEVEIRRSRQRLAEELGRPPASFAFPNGSARDFNPATLAAVRRCGFRAACTTLRGSNRPGCDLMTLRRIGIGPDSLALLKTRLAGLFDQEMRDLLRPNASQSTSTP